MPSPRNDFDANPQSNQNMHFDKMMHQSGSRLGNHAGGSRFVESAFSEKNDDSYNFLPTKRSGNVNTLTLNKQAFSPFKNHPGRMNQ